MQECKSKMHCIDFNLGMKSISHSVFNVQHEWELGWYFWRCGMRPKLGDLEWAIAKNQ